MDDSVCSVNKCPKKVLARSWCSGHYDRWRETGDVRADEALQDQHGMSKTPLYKCWTNMKQRVGNRAGVYPTYAHVGLDSKWETFAGFVAFPPSGKAFEPGLCLSRLNDEGDYTPENTRWLTRAENTGEMKRPTEKDHCVHGHAYTEENTKYGPDGRYRCRECARIRNAEYRRRKAGSDT